MIVKDTIQIVEIKVSAKYIYIYIYGQIGMGPYSNISFKYQSRYELLRFRSQYMIIF